MVFMVTIDGAVNSTVGGSDDSNNSSLNSTVVNHNTSYKDFPGEKQQRAPPKKKLTKCSLAFCHLGKCTDVEGVGAVCSCPDDRLYLAKDGKTCSKYSNKSEEGNFNKRQHI